jgi:hypothetical protein
MARDPVPEALRVPVVVSNREARQRLVGRAARALQVREAFLDPLVQFEAQAEQRDDPVGLMVATPELRINPPGGLARPAARPTAR